MNVDVKLIYKENIQERTFYLHAYAKIPVPRY